VTQSLSESQPRISGHTLYKLYTVQFGTYAFPSQFDTVGANSNYQRNAIFILKVRKLRNLFTHTTDFTNVKIFAELKPKKLKVKFIQILLLEVQK